MIKLQYKVRINYYDFIFDDAQEAVSFAISAKLHQAEALGNNFDVKIDIISIEEDDEAEEPADE